MFLREINVVIESVFNENLRTLELIDMDVH
jgi:hypothetical protein